jgi:hypothetical protein
VLVRVRPGAPAYAAPQLRSGVAELVDAHDSQSCSARSVGSVPTAGTKFDASTIRFIKAEVLQTFDREETSYRLAYLCTLWLRNTARFEPTAADQARGLRMEARGQWISYADLAEKLESPTDVHAIVSDFNLTHLHTLVRAPLEMLRDYCEDYEKENYRSALRERLHATSWYWFSAPPVSFGQLATALLFRLGLETGIEAAFGAGSQSKGQSHSD